MEILLVHILGKSGVFRGSIRNRVEVLENKWNHLEHGRHNYIEVSGIPDSRSDNKLECLVIKIMKAMETEVDDCDIKACHRMGKSKGKSKKTVVCFGNCNSMKGPFITRRN